MAEAMQRRERVARVKVAALWKFAFTDKDGKQHVGLSGSIGPNTQFTVLPNLFRKKDTHPTHILYVDQIRTVKEEKSTV